VMNGHSGGSPGSICGGCSEQGRPLISLATISPWQARVSRSSAAVLLLRVSAWAVIKVRPLEA